MPDYRFYLFGTPRLVVRNQPVAIDTRKALALFAYLVIKGQPQSRDTLATLLWPEFDQTSARAALRRTLSPLRTALNEVADFGREVLTLDPDKGLWCDAIAFQDALSECRTHGHPEDQPCPRCLPPLRKAADLYTDDFMAGFSLRDSVTFDDWQFFEADRLRRDLSRTLEHLVALGQEQGDIPAALNDARRWLNLDPINETAHQALILLYAQSDQRNAALRQYRECVRILDQELGVAPLDATTQLYEAVKENRFHKPATGGQWIATRHSVTHQPVMDNRSLVKDNPMLIGRDSEWDQLARLYNGLRQDGVLVALTGEPGIGKTRLARDFIAYLEDCGVTTLSARCYDGENNLAYTPLIDLLRQGLRQAAGQSWWHKVSVHWLAEAARLVPEISQIATSLPPPLSPTRPGAQNLFYEGLCQVLEALLFGSQPGALWIDDLHLADQSTLDWLAYLARRLDSRPIFLLVTWGNESNPSLGLLRQILRELQANGRAALLPLSPLTPDQSRSLIQNYLDSSSVPSPDFTQWLVQAAGGLPYFLAAYLEAWWQDQIAKLSGNEWPIPDHLRAILGARLATLNESAHQIIQAAAVIGQGFELNLLQIVSGRGEEEIVTGIETLINAGLVNDTGPGTGLGQYEFRHEQLRTLVLEEIGLARGRLLHRRCAERLDKIAHRRANPGMYAQIAYHYQQSGYPEQAAEHYFQAGHVTRNIYANAEALTHFQAALALGYPQRVEIQVQLGELQTLRGDYPQAIQEFETAAAICAPPELPPIEHKIGLVYLRRGSWEQAACHFEAALSDLELVPPEAQASFAARTTADWSLACQRAGKGTKAEALADDAMVLAQQAVDPAALAQVHNLLGILTRAKGQLEQALSHLNESLTFARKLGDLGAQIAALNNRSLVQSDLEKHLQAIESIREALDICLTLGDRHLEAALRNNLADQLRANKQFESAMTELKQAVAIFSEIGKNAQDWEPEIWKLMEW